MSTAKFRYLRLHKHFDEPGRRSGSERTRPEVGPEARRHPTILRTVEIKRLVPVFALLAACVPVTRYEEAESAAQVEAEGRRRAALELEESRRRVMELEASLQARKAELDAKQRAVDEQQLASSISEKERDENASLVEQLRGELSRTGEHLRAFSDEKTRLERELEAAQQAQASAAPPADPGAPAEAPPGAVEMLPPPAGEPAPAPSEPPEQREPPMDLGALARNVQMALSAVGLDKKVKLTTRPDALELEVAEKTLFEDDSAALRANMAALFAAAARLSSMDPSLSGSIREANHDAKLSPALGDERRAQLAATLKQHGLDARIRLEPLDEPVSGAPRAYVLSLRSSARAKSPG